MNGVRFPAGYKLSNLERSHARATFRSGEARVDEWLATKALQQQEKHLSVTKVLVDETGSIAGYYTLATGHVNFDELPPELSKRLPRRLMPVAVLAWLGVSLDRQGLGLGRSLFVQALCDCYEAGKTFAFIAVILDCIGDAAKSFYQQWDFQELPERPYRLFLSAKQLEAMMKEP